MPLDAITMCALVQELSDKLAGSRIDKIQMPKSGDIVLNMRSQSGAFRLLLATSAGMGRAYITELKQENPDTPPMMCMLLRKHLGAGRVVSVQQPEFDRILKITFTATDEMGEIAEKHLICELMGRRSNVMLVDANGIIIACLKRIDADMSPERPVLLGLRYRMPPKQDKQPLFYSSSEQLIQILNSLCDINSDAIVARLEGISPLLARELVFRFGADRHELANQLHILCESAKEGKLHPYLIKKGDKLIDFTSIEITHLGSDVQCERCDNFSQLIDRFYMERTLSDNRKNATATMQRNISNAKNRLEKKLALQMHELESAEGRERVKLNADLIMANLHAIKSGESHAVVTDYFSEEMQGIKISLNSELSPQQNAQNMYKKYARLKNAEQALREQIEKGKCELEYLNSVLYSIESVQNEKEAETLRHELVQSGYLKNREKVNKRVKQESFAPRKFNVDEGLVVLCGRNNRENDELTMRQSQGKDLWFHVRNAPGSHVVMQCPSNAEPSERAVEQAASIAAFYSALGRAGKVSVDYTYVKSVKKPQGAKPGMVNYFNFKTILVEPRESI